MATEDDPAAGDGDADVLLGDVGRPLSEAEELDLALSRLGGRPVWSSQQEADSIMGTAAFQECGLCRRPRAFFGQVLATYEGSQCRVLYFFACLNPACGVDERAWCVLRCVGPSPGVADAAGAKPSGGRSSTAPAAPTAPGQQAQDDDWSAAPALAPAAHDGELEALLLARAQGGGSSSSTHRARSRSTEPAEKWLGAHAAHVAASAPPLPSFALEIYCEPPPPPKSGAHELDLLERYRQSQLALGNEMDWEAEAGAAGRNGGDVEVDSEGFGDRWFLKFQRRLERSQAQVVRYAWGGKPLWISEPPEETSNAAWPPPCPRCRAPRIFEAQLLPTLLYEVRRRTPEQVGDAEIEWGTVLVYTCSADCASGAGEPCQEFVVVQPAV